MKMVTADRAMVNSPVRESPDPLDTESAEWLRLLGGGGRERDRAVVRLHELLLRISRSETRRRSGSANIAGPELDDLAYQAAADALLAITAKIDQFRGESRFTTWAYRFVILEVSAKMGRHFWRTPSASLDAQDWTQLPDRFGPRPERESEWRDLMDALRRAVGEVLTDHQRRIFVAVVLNGVQLDALAIELGSTRNAIYKTMFDARRKLRAALVANGYVAPDDIREPAQAPGAANVSAATTVSAAAALERFLRTDPRDVGCGQAMEILHIYAELVVADADAAGSYPGVAAHLQACGPCAQDFDGLLAAVGIATESGQR